MNKIFKEIILYVVLFSFLFFLPNLMYYYFTEKRENTTYERIAEDYETCFQRAERDKVETRWCREIEKASKLTYTESRNADKSITNIVLQIFPMVLFILMIAVIGLRKQIEELKKSQNS